MLQYALCSSKNCNYHQQYGTTIVAGRSKNIEMKKFCPYCGSLMIGKCPNCGAVIEDNTYKFCPECGKPYK